MMWLILTGTANIGTARSVLASFTGEDDFAAQLHAVPEWLSGLVRQQPQTADFVPIAYNGVNPYGVNTFLNQEVEAVKRARQLDLIRDAGFHWIRALPWAARPIQVS